MTNEEKEKQIASLNQYHSEFFCSACACNPKYTAFDKDSFLSWCEHRRAGFMVKLVDFKPEGPAHIIFPISHLEFLAAAALLSAIAAGIQKQRNDEMERVLSELPDGRFAQG